MDVSQSHVRARAHSVCFVVGNAHCVTEHGVRASRLIDPPLARADRP